MIFNTLHCDFLNCYYLFPAQILAQVSAPVKLKLEKLSDGDIDILKGCATLAMHDHLIQTVGSM